MQSITGSIFFRLTFFQILFFFISHPNAFIFHSLPQTPNCNSLKYPFIHCTPTGVISLSLSDPDIRDFAMYVHSATSTTQMVISFPFDTISEVSLFRICVHLRCDV